ncbi:MAG: hypothetical protein OXI11_09105 [Gammaproteobacteria bacterium]|nr:hypothetical protein [Gammaproteobacteria bacterium]MXW45764.1 hypothetical protein [Gammaproteobacteria bacterium]MYD03128.1 hypothetical protein [Gammaproteobacteria bacterium]MYI25751.1 hypothetical protein [Gammaproteobacteria bacterium]
MRTISQHGLSEEFRIGGEIGAPACYASHKTSCQIRTTRRCRARVVKQRSFEYLAHEGGSTDIPPASFIRQLQGQLTRQLYGQGIHGAMV